MFFSLVLEVAESSLNTESDNRICPKLAASYYNCQKDYVHFYHLRMLCLTDSRQDMFLKQIPCCAEHC